MTYRRRTEIAAGEVRALLGRNRQSIQDLSIATGIPLSTLNSRLLLKRPFSIDELDAIARHFSVPISALVTEPAGEKAS